MKFIAMPFVRLFGALAAGVSVAYWIQPQIHVFHVVCTTAVLSLVLFFATIGATKLRSYRYYPPLSILFYLFLFTLGWARFWQSDPIIQDKHFSNHTADVLIGHIVDEPRTTSKTIRFPVAVTHAVNGRHREVRKGKLLVSIQRDSLLGSKINYRYGDQLIVAADYDTFKPSYNPNEFDYKRYMADQGIWHQSYLQKEQVKKIGENQGSYMIRLALSLRERMVAKLERILLDRDVHAIASTLVLGYRSELDRDLLNTFSVTGTIHVLSVSGLHVGIIFSVFSFLLLWKRKSKWTWLKAVILILLIWFYALITGLSPSVLRASMMLSLGILALSIVRQNQIYNTIAFSAFILLLYNPRFISDIGFQLSYLSVLGIIYFYPKFNAVLNSNNSVLKTLWSYISISLAAQLATFPLVTYYFYFFPVYFLPANLFILLPAAIILYLGILILLLPSGWVQYGLSWLLEKSIQITKSGLIYFEELPYSSLNLRWNEPWHFLLLYTMILAASFFFFYKKKLSLYIIFGGLIILGIDWSIQKFSEEQTNRITIYNVGRNTAISIFVKKNAYLYTDFQNEDAPAFQYSVKPNFSASAKKVTFIHISDTLMLENLFVHGKFIQTGEKSILMYDDPIKLQGNIHVGILYVKNNALPSLDKIQNNICFDKLILDATNAWWYIKKIEREAKKMNIPLYVLKNNYAYVW